jgi:hypothetical protein
MTWKLTCSEDEHSNTLPIAELCGITWTWVEMKRKEVEKAKER